MNTINIILNIGLSGDNIIKLRIIMDDFNNLTLDRFRKLIQYYSNIEYYNQKIVCYYNVFDINNKLNFNQEFIKLIELIEVNDDIINNLQNGFIKFNIIKLDNGYDKLINKLEKFYSDKTLTRDIIPYNILNDKKIILNFLDIDFEIYRIISTKLKYDIDIIDKLFEINSLYGIINVPKELKDNEKLVLKTIYDFGYAYAIEHASDRLKNDRGLLINAIKNNDATIVLIRDELIKNINFIDLL